MARKKTKIQQEWDVALTQLNKAIADAEKAVRDETVAADDLTAMDTKYAAWKRLLDEAVAKIAGWRNERDAKRLEWMRFVNTQKTKTDKNFTTKIAKVKGDAESIIGGKKARVELLDTLENSAIFNLDLADKAIKAAVRAIEGGNVAEAVQKQSLAFNKLKAVAAHATMPGLKKQATIYAKKHGVTLKDVNIADAEVARKFALIQRGYQQYTEAAQGLDDTIDTLTETLANQEPETTNTDVEYKNHLKQSVTNYKTVVDFAKTGLGKVKKLAGDVGKLQGILARTTAGNAAPLVAAVVKLHQAIRTEYRNVDAHIQRTIRESRSTFAQQATDWGITSEDRNKSLAPLMNRAFAINYQCKNLLTDGTEKLGAILEQLVTQFDNAEAKAALPGMSGEE